MMILKLLLFWLLVQCICSSSAGVDPDQQVVTSTTAATSSSIGTAAGEKSNETDDDSCKLFEMDPIKTANFVPSEKAIVTCNCTRSMSNISYTCPEITVDPEAIGIVHFQKEIGQDNDTCSAIWTITALKNNFTARRVQVPLTCATATGAQKNLLLTFEKRSNGDPCKKDIDCWSTEQFCNDDQQCSCYEGLPAYVYDLDKCFPDSGYDHHCYYDEQCMTRDSNTICQNNVCKCRENYWTYTNTNLTCITSGAAVMWIPNQVAIFTTVVLVMSPVGQTW